MESITTRKPRVLVVDDEDSYRRMLERVLGSKYEVQSANSAVQALERVAAGFVPDVAVCDIHMPGDDGFSLTRRLMDRVPDLSVILLTGFRQRDSFVRAMKLQARFLEKNADADEICAAVDNLVEDKRKASRERESLLSELRRESDFSVRRVAKELHGASRLQKRMLPPQQALLGRFRISAHCRGISELCGDFYDFCTVGDDGNVALLCADVMGHGVAPAMLTPLVKSAFRSTPGHDPASVAERLRQLLVWVEPEEYFVALFAAVADPRARTLTYVCAGHPAGLMVGGGEATPLETTGPPVHGNFQPGTWHAATVPFDLGRSLLLFTDGVTDAGGPGSQFGSGRVATIASAFRPGSSSLLDAVLGELNTHLDRRHAHDDITLVVLDHAQDDPAPKGIS